MEPLRFYEDYWNWKIIEDVDEEMVWKAKMLLSVIPRRKFPVVVEMGCGTGGVLNLVAKEVEATHRIGLDISKEALKSAKKIHPIMSCIQAEVSHIPLRDGSVDLVILSDILEHLPRPVEFLENVLQITNYVAFNIPLEKSLFPKLLDKFNGIESSFEYGNHPAGHLFEWTNKDVEQLLGGLNLRICTFKLVKPQKEYFRSSDDRREHRVLGRLSEFFLVNIERISYTISKNLHARLFYAGYFAFGERKHSFEKQSSTGSQMSV